MIVLRDLRELICNYTNIKCEKIMRILFISTKCLVAEAIRIMKFETKYVNEYG